MLESVFVVDIYHYEDAYIGDGFSTFFDAKLYEDNRRRYGIYSCSQKARAAVQALLASFYPSQDYTYEYFAIGYSDAPTGVGADDCYNFVEATPKVPCSEKPNTPVACFTISRERLDEFEEPWIRTPWNKTIAEYEKDNLKHMGVKIVEEKKER